MAITREDLVSEVREIIGRVLGVPTEDLVDDKPLTEEEEREVILRAINGGRGINLYEGNQTVGGLLNQLRP